MSTRRCGTWQGTAQPGKQTAETGGLSFFSEPVAAGAAAVVNLGPWIKKKQ